MWVAGVVPSVVVYNMCDRTRLKSSARALFTFHPDGRALVHILAVLLGALVSVCFKVAPWIVFVTAACFYFLFTAFSVEKTLYMGDWCGAIAKQAFRKVATTIICDVAWMKMKGEWNFCSPYSRSLETESADHYYTLKRPPADYNGSDVLMSHQDVDEFSFLFPLKECEVYCKFKYLVERRDGADRKDGPNKIELALTFKDEPLEEYTYFNVPLICVARIWRLMTVLETEGNLVLCNFHRYVGSGVNVAHARCYEFEEMIKLVLSDGCALKRVNLGARYECSISGSSFPRGTAAGLVLGLACCFVCSLWELSPRMSAGVFAVAMLVFAPMEVDIVRLLAKSKREVGMLLSPVLSSGLARVLRAGLPASGLWF